MQVGFFDCHESAYSHYAADPRCFCLVVRKPEKANLFFSNCSIALQNDERNATQRTLNSSNTAGYPKNNIKNHSIPKKIKESNFYVAPLRQI
jgi:hypothetical protein